MPVTYILQVPGSLLLSQYSPFHAIHTIQIRLQIFAHICLKHPSADRISFIFPDNIQSHCCSWLRIAISAAYHVKCRVLALQLIPPDLYGSLGWRAVVPLPNRCIRLLHDFLSTSYCFIRCTLLHSWMFFPQTITRGLL